MRRTPATDAGLAHQRKMNILLYKIHYHIKIKHNEPNHITPLKNCSIVNLTLCNWIVLLLVFKALKHIKPRIKSKVKQESVWNKFNVKLILHPESIWNPYLKVHLLLLCLTDQSMSMTIVENCSRLWRLCNIIWGLWKKQTSGPWFQIALSNVWKCISLICCCDWQQEQ